MNESANTRHGRVDYAAFMALIERSSLGAPGPQELRRRTATRDALRIMASADEDFRQARDQQPWLGLVGYERHQVCLVAAAAGNTAAMNILVWDLTPLVWHVARGQGLHREAAEDVVSSVWLALLNEIDTLHTARKLAGWLIVTTRRVAAQFCQEHADWSQAVVDAERALTEVNERDNRLWMAFLQLPPQCQELLRLTVLAGRAEYTAVAEAMHIPRGAIGPTRVRCLNKLRGLLADDAVDTDDQDEPVMTEHLGLFLALGQAIDDADPVPELVPRRTA